MMIVSIFILKNTSWRKFVEREFEILKSENILIFLKSKLNKFLERKSPFFFFLIVIMIYCEFNQNIDIWKHEKSFYYLNNDLE